MSTLTVLVMGKGGVGKSSTVNSIVGERAVAVSAFQVSIGYTFAYIIMVKRGYVWLFLFR